MDQPLITIFILFVLYTFPISSSFTMNFEKENLNLIEPTIVPTFSPTYYPSPTPTLAPTFRPSRVPTIQPSTRQPTFSPSAVPTTSRPTCIPTSTPTRAPLSPTSFPTSTPSISHTPTSIPSITPSGYPSSQPTSSPSRQPFPVPSGQPSRQPTSQPTRQPFGTPSGQPSRQPTSQPTRQPFGRPTGQPSRQPTSKPSRQPSRQPTTQPTRQPFSQPTGQPTRQPSKRPSGQPSRQPSGRPTGQPTLYPTTALQIAVIVTVEHSVANAYAYQFSTSAEAELVFIRAVQYHTGLPQSILYVNRVWDSNYTYSLPIKSRDLLQTDQTNVPQTKHRTMTTNFMYVNYTMKFWTTDISPLSSVEESIAELQSRITNALASDRLGLRLRQNTYRYQDLSFRNCYTDSTMQAIVQLSLSRLEHSAKPTSQPSVSPSSQPSTQPSSSPTSMPTLLKQTKWLIRLRSEMANRFSKTDRANRAIYFQLDLGNLTFFSSNDQYASFMSEITRRISLYQDLKTVTLLVGNASSEVLGVFDCDQAGALAELRNAFRLDDRESSSISCNGATWRVHYCNSEDAVPHMCINCDNPCLQQCFIDPALGVSTVLSPTHYNCSYFDGSLKIVHIEGFQPIITAQYVGYSFAALWVVVIASALFMMIYQKYLIQYQLPVGFDADNQSEDDEERSNNILSTNNGDFHRWTVQGFRTLKVYPMGRNETDESVKIELIRTLNEDIFGMFHLYHSTLSRWIHALVCNHRVLRIYNNFSEHGWNIFWFTTTLAGYSLLLAIMMSAQYPYDHGQCAEFADKQSCETYESNFIDHRRTCKWYNEFTPQQEALLGDLLEYQTNCIFNIKQVPSLDVFRLSILGVLLVCFSRTTMLEPFLKRFIVPSLISSEKTLVDIDENGFNRNAPFANKSNKQPSYDKKISAASAVASRSMTMKHNSVLPKPQHMKDFMLEINFADSKDVMTSNGSQLKVNLVPRKEIDDGLKTLESEHVFDMTEENYFKYEVELRGPDAASDKVDNDATVVDNLYQMCCRLNCVGNGDGDDGQLNSKQSRNEGSFQIVHRTPEHFRDEEFRQFYSHILSYRLNIIDYLHQKKFEYHWGLKDGQFNLDRVIHRSFGWQIHNNFQVHQAAGDYFHEYINTVNNIASSERAAATKNSESLQFRILVLFVLDLLGHFSPESSLLSRRLYRRLNPRDAISWWIKSLSVFFLLVLNAVLLYFTWDLLRYFPRDHLKNWYRCLIIAIVLDFFFVENIDNLWYFYVVPSTCLQTYHYVKDETIRIILETQFLAPMMKKDFLYPGASTASSVVPGSKQLNGFSSSASVTSRSIFTRNTLRTANHGSVMSFTNRAFDTPDYFFVSRKFARLFPSLPESHVVLQYHTDLPRRVVVSPWHQNMDIHMDKISFLEPIMPYIYWVLELVWNDYHVDDEHSVNSKETARRSKERQRELAANRQRIREQQSEFNRVQERMKVTIVDQIRSSIVYLGGWPTLVQRVLVQFFAIGVFFLCWYLLPRVAFTGFWFAALAIFVVFVGISFVLLLYYHSYSVRDTLDEAQYISWLSCFGVRPTEYPPYDLRDDDDDIPSEAFDTESEKSSKDGHEGDGDDDSDVSSLSSEGLLHEPVRPVRNKNDDVVHPFDNDKITSAVPFGGTPGSRQQAKRGSSPAVAANSASVNSTPSSAPNIVSKHDRKSRFEGSAVSQQSPNPSSTSLESPNHSFHRTLGSHHRHENRPLPNDNNSGDDEDSENEDYAVANNHNTLNDGKNEFVTPKKGSPKKLQNSATTKKKKSNVDRLLTATVASSLKANKKKSTNKDTPQRGVGLRGSTSSIKALPKQVEESKSKDRKPAVPKQSKTKPHNSSTNANNKKNTSGPSLQLENISDDAFERDQYEEYYDDHDLNSDSDY